MSTTIEKMESLFSPKYGIGNFSIDSTRRVRNVKAENCKVTLGNIIPTYNFILGHKDLSTWAGGAVSLNKEKCKIKTFGEFMERYSSSYVKNENNIELLHDSYDNLTTKGISCYDLSNFVSFLDFQYDQPKFTFSRYSTANPILWAEGRELTGNKKLWLPAQKMFLSHPGLAKEPRYIQGMSTGCACGETFKQAALSGLYEVIERDSFMLTWLLQLPGVRIDMDSFKNKDLQVLYRHINKYLVGEDELHIYDISRTEGVYTVCTFIRNDLPHAFGLIVSAASHKDPEMAVLKSLEELCQCQSFAFYNLFKDEDEKRKIIDKEDVKELDDHVFYYSTSRRNGNIDFIASTEKSICISKLINYSKDSIETDLEDLLDDFKQRREPVFALDLTKPEIRDAGFHVLKIAVPDYLDINIPNNANELGSKRLQNLKQKHNTKINDEPHPFP